MTATQTQIRRDTASNLDGVTPALAELGYDTTNKRLRAGDGSTLGGIMLPNYIDNQKHSFQAATVGGTADAITLTISPAPAAYSTHLTIRFLATGTNTGAVTVDVNGLGTKSLYKLSSGALNDLSAGDIVSGAYYEITYNGTEFQVLNIFAGGLISVSQGNLNTSTGIVSRSASGTNQYTGPGGQYGFWPTLHRSSTHSFSGAYASPYYAGQSSDLLTTTSNYIALSITTYTSGTFSAQQRYITSSPPFDMGDGEAGGFFFATVDNNGKIVDSYVADVPPWAYNGKTRITADYQCPITKKKFIKKNSAISLRDTLNGRKNKPSLVEITNDLKNADMSDIPHPFLNVDPGLTVIMLDPMDDKMKRLIDFQNENGSQEIIDQISGGYFEIDNTPIKRCAPDGVKVCKFKYKFSGKK